MKYLLALLLFLGTLSAQASDALPILLGKSLLGMWVFDVNGAKYACLSPAGPEGLSATVECITSEDGYNIPYLCETQPETFFFHNCKRYETPLEGINV